MGEWRQLYLNNNKKKEKRRKEKKEKGKKKKSLSLDPTKTGSKCHVVNIFSGTKKRAWGFRELRMNIPESM